MLSLSFLHPYHFPLACCPFSSVTQDIFMVHSSLKHKCSFILDVLSMVCEHLCIHKYRSRLCSKGYSLNKYPAKQIYSCPSERDSSIKEANLKVLFKSMLTQKFH